MNNILQKKEEMLEPYAVKSFESRGRKYSEEEHAYRTPFQRDRDRIIHSTAFRRLEYKTQVFVNYEGDHYRTRLTHTLEVSQIGRVIARALNLNEDLTETIALAHDLGHTAFGHSGEEALNQLMEGAGNFEHNAQGLRVVDVLESRYSDFPGLNLSFEVREGFATHSSRHDFPAGHEDFADVKQPPLEAQIVNIADEIAYDTHDLDDGLSSGILNYRDIEDLKIWQCATNEFKIKEKLLPENLYRANAIRNLINIEVSDILQQTEKNIRDASVKKADDIRALEYSLVANSPEIAAMKEELEDFLKDKFYRYYTVARMASKAKRFITELFNAYVAEPVLLPDEHKELIEKHGLKRTVCDYIAGMTDRFAEKEYHKLFYPQINI
ncbi:MAG: deoxyguanosinetriphosphate triphosphohydrolase [Planctomycetota bacterium]|jgi:dGTPase